MSKLNASRPITIGDQSLSSGKVSIRDLRPKKKKRRSNRQHWEIEAAKERRLLKEKNSSPYVYPPMESERINREKREFLTALEQTRKMVQNLSEAKKNMIGWKD